MRTPLATRIEDVQRAAAEPSIRGPVGRTARAVWTLPGLRVAVRRILIAIPALWGVTLLTFIVMNVLPGDAATQLLGAQATPAEIRQLSIKLHLNEPFPERYWNWLRGAVTGNLGTSFANSEPVRTIVGQKLPITLELVAYSFVIALVIAIPAAVLVVRRPRGIPDRLSFLVSMTGLSIAPYVLGLLLTYALAVKVRWFPPIGWVPPGASIGGNLRSLTLPAVSMGFPLACFYTRLLRADLLEQMQSEDYVVTARAKGIGPWRLITYHVLRNSSFGLLTLVGLNVGTIVGSTVVIEEIFSIPGIGQQLLLAISNRDVPLVEGIVLVLAVMVIVANLATDLLYGVLDPRVRHGRSLS